MNVLDCPNCAAVMDDLEPCPECDHDGGDPDCECDYCEGERFREHIKEIM